MALVGGRCGSRRVRRGDEFYLESSGRFASTGRSIRYLARGRGTVPSLLRRLRKMGTVPDGFWRWAALARAGELHARSDRRWAVVWLRAHVRRFCISHCRGQGRARANADAWAFGSRRAAIGIAICIACGWRARRRGDRLGRFAAGGGNAFEPHGCRGGGVGDHGSHLWPWF